MTKWAAEDHHQAATRAGFVVTQCLEGRDALRIATDEQPDLVLLDVIDALLDVATC